MGAVQSVTFVYASGSGHTEWVVHHAVECLRTLLPEIHARVVRAEEAVPEDLAKAQTLVLASGTWNTGGVEGQLHPYMYALLNGSAKTVDLGGRPCSIIALGDHRYFYTARAGEYLRSYIVTHGGKVAVDALTVIDEPYGQEEKIAKWTQKLATFLNA